jgi:hypothetical protein
MMKKILFLTKCAKRRIFAVCCMAILSAAIYSCTDIYDGIKDFSVEEIVYPAHFDTIYGNIGFERVEIDLCKAGRIPASKIKLGKAKKTIVEFSKNGADTTIIFDSVCSWVSVGGLSLPNIYRFKIYTADEFGDKSTPKEIALIPYTADDRDAMSLPDPNVLSSTTSAQVQWKSSISSDMCDVLSWSYSYIDRNNDIASGSGENDAPAFFIENVPPGTPVTVNILTKVIPKIDGFRILDTIEWLFPVTVNITGTKPIIFLDRPYLNDILTGDGEILPTFSWLKVDEVRDYLLKISSSSNFSDDETTVIPVGDIDSYTLSADEFRSLRWMSLYWTVVPAMSADVITQNRKFWKYINTVAEMRENYVHLTSIKDGTKLDGLMNFTVEGLLKPTSEFGTLNSFFGVEGYFLLRFGDSGVEKYTLQVATNSGGWATSLRLGTMNAWHHVAVTYDVAASTSVVYLNGEEVSRKDGDAPGNYTEGISFSGRDVHIGKSYDDGRHFRGDMSEVRVWSTVRTKEEIANNMFSVNPNTPGLAGYWKFNEGSGRDIHDLSVNGFNNSANKDIVWKEP